MGYSLPDFRNGTESLEEANATGNGTHSKDRHQSFSSFENTIFLVYVVISLLGLVGNGIVIWLLGFRIKKNPFSVYILNLAYADFIFSFCNCIFYTLHLLAYKVFVLTALLAAVIRSSFLVDLCLLIAISTERCVAVLCPLWYRCHRPKHLSSILCALIWGLAFCMAILLYLVTYLELLSINKVYLVYYIICLLTFLVLCVSSLTLLMHVQCGSRRRQTTRLYKTILLNVLTFLLLGLPFGIGLLTYSLLPEEALYRPFVARISILFSILNSLVNPVIYFFVGRHRQTPGWKPLREVLWSALTDDT
ncbi:mas-related G-protein coupled receptor member X1-like [Erinaceus europaeus]|uniref:Mas-related G-protein coupled receptor member X1-like n=1 Tax=Erinaceus europaeus TaxID=9365 RepID=A0A1S2ZI30_ERIEU|nr:mas-related G-protein coupled receptor member X1-like [Erinaceus europaeus]